MAPQPWSTISLQLVTSSTVTSPTYITIKVRKPRPHRHANWIMMVCRTHTTMEHTVGDTARSKVMRFGARETAESILLLCQTVVDVPVARRPFGGFGKSAPAHALPHAPLPQVLTFMSVPMWTPR